MELMEDGTTIERQMFAMAAEKKVPLYGVLELLPLCNLNCDMCYVRMSREEMNRVGRLCTIEEWTGIAEAMMKAGTLFVLLTGGEPLLYPHFRELYQKLRELGMIVTINTNGTLIDEKWADFFAENKPRRMNITLYGAGNETYERLCHYPGGFDKAVNGIRLLRERNIDVKVNGSLAKANVDDRMKIIETGESLEMARMAADSGVDRIIATPHCNIPGMYGNYFGREYIDRYESVVRAVRKEKIPIEILPGMEVFSTEDLPELIVNHKIMPLNQSRYILMEFAFDEDPEFADSILKRVEEVGARPVIAHAERYEFIQDYPQIAYRWFRKGYVIQANKGSFLGRFGGGPKRAADSLLRHNLISVIASDAHSPLQRTPYMLDAYEELSREYSENHLDVLFQYNPARLCDNREILRLEPVPYSGR